MSVFVSLAALSRMKMEGYFCDSAYYFLHPLLKLQFSLPSAKELSLVKFPWCFVLVFLRILISPSRVIPSFLSFHGEYSWCLEDAGGGWGLFLLRAVTSSLQILSLSSHRLEQAMTSRARGSMHLSDLLRVFTRNYVYRLSSCLTSLATAIFICIINLYWSNRQKNQSPWSMYMAIKERMMDISDDWEGRRRGRWFDEYVG